MRNKRRERACFVNNRVEDDDPATAFHPNNPPQAAFSDIKGLLGRMEIAGNEFHHGHLEKRQ